MRGMSRRKGSAVVLACAWLGCAGAGSRASEQPAKGAEPGAGSMASDMQGASAAGGDGMAASGGASASTAGSPAQGGAAASGAAGNGPVITPGGFVPDSTPADPSIMFEWNETIPAGASQGDCMPGTYSGTFTCQAILTPGDPSSAIEVTGPVFFTLTRSQNGEFLEISEGRLDGYAMLFINFTSALSGKLDCSSNTLDAMAVDGVYGFGDVNALPTGTFDGSLSGMLDRATATLSGTWMLTEGTGIACDGPWTATLTP